MYKNKTQLKRHVKTAFQTQFFSGPYSKKYSLMCYQTPYCIFYTTNTKTSNKQTQPNLLDALCLAI